MARFTREKRYRCEVCGKRFATKAELSQHTRDIRLRTRKEEQ